MNSDKQVRQHYLPPPTPPIVNTTQAPTAHTLTENTEPSFDMPGNFEIASGINTPVEAQNNPTIDQEVDETQPPLRRSIRTQIPTNKFLESVSQQTLTFEPQTITCSSYYEAMYEDDYELQDQMNDPIAFLATANKDTFYYHEAMKAPDRDEFLTAMQKEFDSHVEKEHYKLIDRDDVPEEEDVLDAVWSMKRKRNILTNEIYKYKTSLNIHGGQQEYAKNFYETYSPVVNWFSIRLLLIHAMLFKWLTRQVDFTIAFPQADIEFPLFMKVPPGIKLKGKDKRNKVLELEKNLYG